MTSSFNKSIASDTLNGTLALDKLEYEINNSSIAIALKGMLMIGDNLKVEFVADISAGEEVILVALLADHDGIKLTYVEPENFSCWRLKSHNVLTITSGREVFINGLMQLEEDSLLVIEEDGIMVIE